MLVSELNLAALFQRLDAAPAAGEAVADAGADSGYDAALAAWYDVVNLGSAPHLAPGPAATAPLTDAASQPAGTPGTLAAMLAGVGVTPWVVDLTRPGIDVPVVKVLAPGLAHYRGWTGAGRLRDVPRRLGWRSALSPRQRHFPHDLLI